jgi:hypothetical protein
MEDSLWPQIPPRFFTESVTDFPASRHGTNPVTDHVTKLMLFGSHCYNIKSGAIRSSLNV